MRFDADWIKTASIAGMPAGDALAQVRAATSAQVDIDNVQAEMHGQWHRGMPSWGDSQFVTGELSRFQTLGDLLANPQLFCSVPWQPTAGHRMVRTVTL